MYRYLYHTQAETFMKFKEMHPDINISQSSFYRLKPAEVCKTSPSSRLTCGCVKCMNIKFLVQELGVKVSDFLDLHTCDHCKLTQCDNCKDQLKISFEAEEEIDIQKMAHRHHGSK